jgi:CheY-like chemotaxis protein
MAKHGFAPLVASIDAPYTERLAMSESTRPACVLVVDDDPGVRRMMDAALRERGFEVCVAADGGEAVELLPRHRPEVSVVLLDVLMPGMDGPATLRALREVSPGIPVCFYTAFSGSYSEADLISAGGGAVLSKPCPLDTLAATLTSLLPRAGADNSL